MVVPSATAWDAVAADGRRALARTLSDHLAAHFERVLLPRAWRFVAALPSNAQGKVTHDALRGLFAVDSPPDAPERLAAARSENALEARVRIPWDLAHLDGHFPGAPVVGGVAQLHFAMGALEELLGEPPALAALEALKFHDVLLPGQEVLLRVERRDERPLPLLARRRGAAGALVRERPRQPGAAPMKVCALIPIFDHGATIEKVVSELPPDLPCLIVDDGSAEATREALAARDRRARERARWSGATATAARAPR